MNTHLTGALIQKLGLVAKNAGFIQGFIGHGLHRFVHRVNDHGFASGGPKKTVGIWRIRGHRSRRWIFSRRFPAFVQHAAHSSNTLS